MDIDPETLEERDQYKLLMGGVLPRPIALVTTLGPCGVNAAPFSLFNVAGTLPPLLVFSVSNQANGTEKDTVRNLRRLPECVVHICNSAISQRMNICATDYPADVSELDVAAFTQLPSYKVRPPRIKEAPIQMECRVVKIIDFGARRHNHVVFGEVVYFHFHDGIVNERYHVNLARLDPIGRLSGSLYVRVSDTFSLERQFLGEKPDLLT